METRIRSSFLTTMKAKKETYKEISIVIGMEDVTEEEVASINAASGAGTISSKNDLEMESLVFFPNPSDGKLYTSVFSRKQRKYRHRGIHHGRKESLLRKLV